MADEWGQANKARSSLSWKIRDLNLLVFIRLPPIRLPLPSPPGCMPPGQEAQAREVPTTSLGLLHRAALRSPGLTPRTRGTRRNAEFGRPINPHLFVCLPSLSSASLCGLCAFKPGFRFLPQRYGFGIALRRERGRQTGFRTNPPGHRDNFNFEFPALNC